VQVAVRVVSSSTGVEHVADGLKDTVYPVMGEPPLDGEYDHVTTAEVSVTSRAARPVGAIGAVGTPTLTGVAFGSLGSGGDFCGLAVVTTTTRNS
jgi:hypothetical protein